MPILGLFSLFFGITVLTFPDFLSYLIGFLFLFIGINSLVMTWMMHSRNSSGTPKSWNFGKYEIIKKK